MISAAELDTIVVASAAPEVQTTLPASSSTTEQVTSLESPDAATLNNIQSVFQEKSTLKAKSDELVKALKTAIDDKVKGKDESKTNHCYSPNISNDNTAVNARVAGLQAELKSQEEFAVAIGRLEGEKAEVSNQSEAKDARIDGLEQQLKEVKTWMEKFLGDA